MATLFDLAADGIEHHTTLDRLEARGTLRLALKQAGVEVRALTLEQLRVVFERIMVSELESRGVRAAGEACARALDDVVAASPAESTRSGVEPDEVFRRLGGD